MCGIVGGVSDRNVLPILIEGLKRLEYRGYDSAGVAFRENSKISLIKAKGRVLDLENKLPEKKIKSNQGIAHTRWATHGVPSEKNAHPQISENKIFVVHNGIIENHLNLREKLQSEGVKFRSDTDTEVVAHLINLHMQKGMDFDSATLKAISQLKGAYALAVIDKDNPDLIIGARNQSPLVIGEGYDENFVASDIMALAPVTNKFKFMEDGQVAFITKEKNHVITSNGNAAKLKTQEIDSNSYTNDLGGYNHFMEKEIFEQPDAISKSIEGRLGKNETQEGIFGSGFEEAVKDVTNIQIIACGTSFHSGRIFEYWSHKFLGINCRVDYGSEYQYQEPIKTKKTLLVTISQSGETADTLASLRYCKTNGATIGAIVNVPESTIAREADRVFQTIAGPEIGVASTKAFTCQLAVLAALALQAGRERGVLTPEREQELVAELTEVPSLALKALACESDIEKLAHRLSKASNALYLGRATNFPLALEGALKLKELSYIHAEGYAAGELKHGPIALIDENMPVFVIAPYDAIYEKTVSNMQEVAARGGRIVLITDRRGATECGNAAENTVILPDMSDIVAPIIYALPVQLIAYHTAVFMGTDVDQPRNLAKSVTVE